MKRIGFAMLFVGILGAGLLFSEASVIGGTEEQLRAVIDYMFGDEITIAAMPENLELGFDLPIADNTELLASIVSNNPNHREGNSQIIRLLMQSEGTLPSSIAEFYQSYFQENGWDELTFEFNEERGFYGSDMFNGRYCLGTNYYIYYSISTSEVHEQSRIEWDMTIITEPNTEECIDFSSNPEGFIQLSDFIPQFQPIEGVELLEYVAGPVHNPHVSVTYPAGLALSIPMENVFEVYNQELVAAGWTLQSSEIHESFAISDWLIQSNSLGELSGRLLIVQKAAGSNEYTAYVSVER